MFVCRIELYILCVIGLFGVVIGLSVEMLLSSQDETVNSCLLQCDLWPNSLCWGDAKWNTQLLSNHPPSRNLGAWYSLIDPPPRHYMPKSLPHPYPLSAWSPCLSDRPRLHETCQSLANHKAINALDPSHICLILFLIGRHRLPAAAVPHKAPHPTVPRSDGRRFPKPRKGQEPIPCLNAKPLTIHQSSCS